MFELNGKINRNWGVRVARVSVLTAGMTLIGVAGAMAQQPQQDLPGMTAMAQAVPSATQATSTPAPQAQTQPPKAESEGPQILHLLVGRSLVISSPTRIKRVSLADPAIADAIVVSPYQVLVNGQAPGGVSLLLWDETDQSQAFEVSVDIDILGLSQKIHEVFPAEPVQVETSRDSVILSGQVSSAAVADKILEVVKDATPKVTSLMEVPVPPVGADFAGSEIRGSEQIAQNQLGSNLRVCRARRMSERSRRSSSLRLQLDRRVERDSGSPRLRTLGLSNLLNIFFFRPDINLAATIQALQAENILQILAEPNLLTASGKEASFLAGGQFPYPVLQGSNGGSFAESRFSSRNLACG